MQQVARQGRIHEMKNYGRASIHEFLGDMIVYRKLVPMEPRLPSFSEVREHLGLSEGSVPRKSQPDYARVLAFLLRQARALDGTRASIERLLYVGDTRMNDGSAFENICRAGGWPGIALIAQDGEGSPRMEMINGSRRILCLANRWSGLAEFGEICREKRFLVDESTAVVIDLDKTALGARGRNDHVIDDARVEAVRRTVGALLGDGFDAARFSEAYEVLNHPEFHPFTSDNQDYVAYMCLVLASGLCTLDALLRDRASGRTANFHDFLAAVNGRAAAMSPELRDIHCAVLERVLSMDPTPLKEFRFNEYHSTIERLGSLDDHAPVSDLLASEIVVTQEVREAALGWKASGALLFGLSDKPDEASIPLSEQAAMGYQPIHRVETHSVGV
jgi:hypothetical protein